MKIQAQASLRWTTHAISDASSSCRNNQSFFAEGSSVFSLVHKLPEEEHADNDGDGETNDEDELSSHLLIYLAMPHLNRENALRQMSGTGIYRLR